MLPCKSSNVFNRFLTAMSKVSSPSLFWMVHAIVEKDSKESEKGKTSMYQIGMPIKS